MLVTALPAFEMSRTETCSTVGCVGRQNFLEWDIGITEISLKCYSRFDVFQSADMVRFMISHNWSLKLSCKFGLSCMGFIVLVYAGELYVCFAP
jgi:hypothetical protein